MAAFLHLMNSLSLVSWHFFRSLAMACWHFDASLSGFSLNRAALMSEPNRASMRPSSLSMAAAFRVSASERSSSGLRGVPGGLSPLHFLSTLSAALFLALLTLLSGSLKA